MKKLTNISFVFIIGLYVLISVSFCGIGNVKGLTSNNNLILSQSKEVNQEEESKNNEILNESSVVEESMDKNEALLYKLKCIILILITSLLLTHIQRYKKYKVVKKYKEVEKTNEIITEYEDNQFDIMDINTNTSRDLINMDENNKPIDEGVINKSEDIKDNKINNNVNRNNKSKGSNNTRTKKPNNSTNTTNNNTNRNNRNSNKSNYNRNNNRKFK